MAIALLLTAPIRRKNLVSIHLDQEPAAARRWVGLPRLHPRGGQEPAADRVRAAAGRRHDDRPAAGDAFAAALPAGDAVAVPAPRRHGPMHDDGLSKRIREQTPRELGLSINPHLFRHLSAMLMLDANPGAYEAVRHLLGHAQLSSTLNVYTGLEARTAARLFAEAVEAARQR